MATYRVQWGLLYWYLSETGEPGMVERRFVIHRGLALLRQEEGPGYQRALGFSQGPNKYFAVQESSTEWLHPD